jgi:hypothetical protein
MGDDLDGFPALVMGELGADLVGISEEAIGSGGIDGGVPGTLRQGERGQERGEGEKRTR